MPGLKQCTSPEKTKARQLPFQNWGPAGNECRILAKVVETLASIPGSFLPSSGSGLATSSQKWKDGGRTGAGPPAAL